MKFFWYCLKTYNKQQQSWHTQEATQVKAAQSINCDTTSYFTTCKRKYQHFPTIVLTVQHLQTKKTTEPLLLHKVWKRNWETVTVDLFESIPMSNHVIVAQGLSSRYPDCNWTLTHNHLVHKWTLIIWPNWPVGHLAKWLAVWPVWPNGWVFIYERSGCGFESSSSHLNFRFCTCLE